VWICGAANAERERHGQRRDGGGFQARVLATLDDARDRLGADAFAASWQAGAGNRPADAITQILAELGAPGAEPPRGP
jgi:hypothetical protein